MRTFKTGNINKEGLAVSENLLPVYMLPVAITQLAFIGVDVLLQRKRKINFFSFNDQVRSDLKQKLMGTLARNMPAKLWAMLRVSFGMVINVYATPKGRAHLSDDGFVAHPDHNSDLVGGMNRTTDELPNPDHSFPVKEAGHIFNFHGSSYEVTAEKIANSVETRCPAQMGAEGQYRTKQEAFEPLGVRNEQVLSAKAKVCSEPSRNVGKSAEMADSRNVTSYLKVHHGVTDCNTKYLMFRPHADRNFVPIGGERQAVNQDAIVKLIGWAGNLTTSGSQFNGVLIA